MRVCSYEIDADDRIVSVDRAWCEFAAANGAPLYALPTHLYGRSLWSFISDSTTRHIYQVIVSRVRRQGGEVRVPFRCDSPSEKRWFELKVNSTPSGGVRFDSCAVHTEPQNVTAFVTGGPGEGMLRMCSWCKDIETEDGWEPVEHAVARLRIFSAGEVPQVTHGICPPCARKFEEGSSVID